MLIAHSRFRMPQFAKALLSALQSGDVLDHDVPEFRGITFSLDCTDELPLLAENGFAEHPPIDWRNLHYRADHVLMAAASTNTSTAASTAASTGAATGAATGASSIGVPSPPRSPPIARQSLGARGKMGSSEVVLALQRESPGSDLDAASPRSRPDLDLDATDLAAADPNRRLQRGAGGSASWAARLDSTTHAEAAAARAANDLLTASLRSCAWRDRLCRRGHMFCRLFWEWMQVVCDSLEASMPPHFVPWQRLPGFKTMLICILLEMRSRPVTAYSEPMVQITNQILRCTHLHSLLVKIVFLKTSLHDVPAVSTSLNLLSSWMTSLQQRLLADSVRSVTDSEAAPVSQPLLRSTFDFVRRVGSEPTHPDPEDEARGIRTRAPGSANA